VQSVITGGSIAQKKRAAAQIGRSFCCESTHRVGGIQRGSGAPGDSVWLSQALNLSWPIEWFPTPQPTSLLDRVSYLAARVGAALAQRGRSLIRRVEATGPNYISGTGCVRSWR